jgi:S-adenosylmethionine hydrolase
VTLTTDFGTADSYAAEMKGHILAGCPAAVIVDITHAVPPHDVECGAYHLARAARAFPPGTVHVAVVDPGVGGPRRPLVVRSSDADLVGPDNGLLDPFLAGAEIRVIQPARLLNHHPSRTFHGRDLFAPAAARLASGQALRAFTTEAMEPVRLQRASAAPRVLHIDRFGNCITSLSPADLDPAGGWLLRAGSHEIRTLVETYSQAPENEAVLICGSGGLLEIALREDSAARRLGIGRNTSLKLEKGNP